ncbi:hypothetical protein F5Y08DRAFT_272924 [Xylaria arbuscula]|nr:hypothetical protein F5Y08DRAFT_272924 [Xylaria arbuscula]
MLVYCSILVGMMIIITLTTPVVHYLLSLLSALQRLVHFVYYSSLVLSCPSFPFLSCSTQFNDKGRRAQYNPLTTHAYPSTCPLLHYGLS